MFPRSYNSFSSLEISFFKLVQIHPDKAFFVKEHILNNKPVEFKNTPHIFFPQVFKHYFKMELCAEDFIFYHEGFKSKFIDKLF